MNNAVLSCENLSVEVPRAGSRLIIAGVDLALKPGEILGLAGESGCGKSTLGLTSVAFVPPGLHVRQGSVLHEGQDLLSVGRIQLARAWGMSIAHLPQNASTALNPALRIGTQLEEPLKLHLGLGRKERESRALELLDSVGLPDPEAALKRYPHEFSGGQQQRIALAIAVSCDPAVLILDEPTTGLDVTTQARINKLISSLVRRSGMSTIYVSHNLALLASICDDLAIMYAGQVIERGPARSVFRYPHHPYTAALIRAIPSPKTGERPEGLAGVPPNGAQLERCPFLDRCAYRRESCETPVALSERPDGALVRCVRADELELSTGAAVAPTAPAAKPSLSSSPKPLLEIDSLRCVYRGHGGSVVAVDNVSFAAQKGSVLGIAGESGSGKSTLLKCVSGLQRWTGGDIRLDDLSLPQTIRKRTRDQRRRVQLVFQNPDASLNPLHTVEQILERSAKVLRPELARDQRCQQISELVDRMRLNSSVLRRRAEELSGGQRQRVALARALVGNPEVILCDEVTSALDVSVQATIIELLAELCEAKQTTIVFVTHDLGVLRCLSDELLVMQSGRIVEHGRTGAVYAEPAEEYTRDLLAAVPDPGVASNGGDPSEA